eukprot:m.178604 g.178604  ORF g.178604 m.178604 type:complete len:135 (+) comp21423_c0_seq1:858-1262(+)
MLRVPRVDDIQAKCIQVRANEGIPLLTLLKSANLPFTPSYINYLIQVNSSCQCTDGTSPLDWRSIPVSQRTFSTAIFDSFCNIFQQKDGAGTFLVKKGQSVLLASWPQGYVDPPGWQLWKPESSGGCFSGEFCY